MYHTELFCTFALGKATVRLQLAMGMNKEDKEMRYRRLLPQVEALCKDETDEVARMANVCALLHAEFGFWWTGFYRVLPVGGHEHGQLVLGPFQGPLACMRIDYGRGVCGTAWKEGRTVVVPDVEQFPGHIACSAESRSEVVVPLRKEGKVTAVLDIDSRELATFDEVDARWLEQVAAQVVR